VIVLRRDSSARAHEEPQEAVWFGLVWFSRDGESAPGAFIATRRETDGN
jgi:hypothetical protein